MFPTAPRPIQARSGTIEEASISAWYIDCQCPGENNLLPTLLVECAAWGAGKAPSLQLVGLGSMAFLSLACARHCGGSGGGTLLGEGGKGRDVLLEFKSTAPGTSLPIPEPGGALCVCVCACVHPVIAL